MSEENEAPSAKPNLIERGKKLGEITERASSVAESASTAFNAIKWVAIAVVTLVLGSGVFGVYKIISAPAKAVGSAAEPVTQTVKSGTDKIKQGGSDILNHLDIPSTNSTGLNRLADKVFERLSSMPVNPPADVKERLYWRTQFPGHENKVCRLSMNFGNGDIPVLIAADNAAYATAKALGAKEGRLIRIVITAGEDNIAFRLAWEDETSAWSMKWRATTLQKPVSDKVAEARILDVLKQAENDCR